MIEELEKTIEYWDEVLKNNVPDKGKSHFSLCQEYWNESTCYGCPIMEETGVWRCCGTPYEEWVLHHRRVHENLQEERKIECEDCELIALKYKALLNYILRKEKSRKKPEQVYRDSYMASICLYF